MRNEKTYNEIMQKLRELDARSKRTNITREQFDAAIQKARMEGTLIHLDNDDHWRFWERNMIEVMEERPKKSKAGKTSGKKRKKNSTNWKEKFLRFYHDHPKKRINSVVSDSEIIHQFILKFKKFKTAPKGTRAYYNYLKK